MQSPPMLPHAQGPAPALASDTVDVADIARTLRRQWRAVLAFMALGALAALLVVLFAPRRYDGKVSVLARPGGGSGGSISGRIEGLGQLLGGLGSIGLQGSLETELQVLRSRALAGQVVDSLQLQFVVEVPAGTPAPSLVAASRVRGTFAPRVYEFSRQADGRYVARSGDQSFLLAPGTAGTLDVGNLTLRPGALPPSFRLRVLDREDAISRFGKRLSASKAGGDVAKVTYRGDDSLTAAHGANALIHYYLERRKTTDRGVNQRRVEYVTAQLDQTALALERAESDLRRTQERTRIFDPEIQGEIELTAAAQLRRALTDLQVEEGAIRQLLVQADAGRITARDIAAYPAFMRGSSVSPLAQQLSDLEARRIALLERRTEGDPEVAALDSTAMRLEAGITQMARSYAASITRQREQLEERVDNVQRTLLALPAAAEVGGRLQRDVLRLTQIYTALQAQLVEARLAAIGEGGEIRQIDMAVPPRKAAFPRPLLTMGIGTAGGLLAGVMVAMFLGWFGRWLRDPSDIERAVGISAERFERDTPLLVGNPAARSVLVVPLAPRAQTAAVAERLARTARQRALEPTLLDLSGAHENNGRAAVDVSQVSRMLDEIEQRNGMAIVRLPDLTSDIALAAMRDTRPVVLVAPPGPVDRLQLATAVDLLRRMQVPCAGVVISEPTPRLRALV